MAKPHDIELNSAEQRRLAEFASNGLQPARIALRATIILELAKGDSRQDVAERLGISTPTVALWQRRYQHGGIASLHDRSRPGRPRRARDVPDATETARRRTADPSRKPATQLSDAELDRLVAAARRTISRRGFSATRVADIAAEAGVSPATIHYYFKTKNEILVRALLWASEQLLPSLEEIRADSDALTLLARYIERTIPYPGVQRDEYLLEIDLWSHVRLHPELLPSWEAYEERWLAHVSELVAHGIASGAFTSTVPAEELAERLVALTDGLSAQTAINAKRMPPERARELIHRFASEQLGVAVEALKERTHSD